MFIQIDERRLHDCWLMGWNENVRSFFKPSCSASVSHPLSASCVWINMNVRDWEHLTRLIKHNFGGKCCPGPLNRRCGPLSVSVCSVVQAGQAWLHQRSLEHRMSGKTSARSRLCPAATLSHSHQHNIVNSPIRPHEKSKRCYQSELVQRVPITLCSIYTSTILFRE